MPASGFPGISAQFGAVWRNVLGYGVTPGSPSAAHGAAGNAFGGYTNVGTALVVLPVPGPEAIKGLGYPGLYLDEVLADSPTSYWRLGESSGTVVDDYQNVQDGTYTNTYTLAQTGALTADDDLAAKFVDEAYAQVAQNTAYNTTDVTVECWAKIPSMAAVAASWHYMWMRYNSQTAYLGISNDPAQMGASRHGLQFAWPGGTVAEIRVDPGTFDNNAWHHFVGVNRSGERWLYIDGIRADSYTPGNPLYIAATGTPTAYNTAASTMFGGAPLAWTGNSVSAIYGTLDEVAYYTYGLSDDRIIAHYRAGSISYRERVMADNALAHWRLGEASGSTAYEAVVGLDNGTINGSVTLGEVGAVA